MTPSEQRNNDLVRQGRKKKLKSLDFLHTASFLLVRPMDLG